MVGGGGRARGPSIPITKPLPFCFLWLFIYCSFLIKNIYPVAEQGGVGGEGPAPSQGRQFRSQIYFYYTNRDANIYLAPGGNTPCSATVEFNILHCEDPSSYVQGTGPNER